MSIIQVCGDAKDALPEGHVADIEARIKWDGHEAEAWLASSDVLVVEEWTRGMCEKGCKAYGQTPMCPPNLPDVEEVKRTFSEYDTALFIRYLGFNRMKDCERIESAKLLSDLVPEDQVEIGERKGLRLKIREISDRLVELGYKTLPMSAGHCRLCEPPVCGKKECTQPDVSMPAMEGMGIEVFKTMPKLGHEMHKLPPDYKTFSFYNAILIARNGS